MSKKKLSCKQRLLRLYFRLLAKLARRYINKSKPIVVGVTGSVGKTSARMGIFAVLDKIFGDKKKIYTPAKNLN